MTFSSPMLVTRKGSFLRFLPIVVSRIAIFVILPAKFPELSILYKGIGEGSGIVFMFFSCIYLLWIKENEVPESIIAFTNILESL
jgi:hypothetical protein